MSKKLRLVILSMMGRCPFGGQTWLSLNWLRGLAGLGHEVWYVEDDSVWPLREEPLAAPRLHRVRSVGGYKVASLRWQRPRPRSDNRRMYGDNRQLRIL